MDGCTSSGDNAASLSLSREPVRKRKRSGKADDNDTFLSLHTKYDNDPLDRYRSRIMRMLRTNGTVDDLRQDDSFVPRESHDLLYRLSRQKLDVRDHVSLTLYAYVLVREVERISLAAAEAEALADDAAASNAEAEMRTNTRNLERILRTVDDFTLAHRFDTRVMSEELQNGGVAGLSNHSTGDGVARNAAGEDPDVMREAHRSVFWIARCKIINLLRNVAHAVPPPESINEPMRVRAEALSDEQFARWMQARNVCDRSLLLFDNPDGGVSGHTLQQTNLLSLWLTIKMTTSRWLYLPFDEYAFRLVSELLRRVAFFVSYRENTDPRTASGRALMNVTGSASKKVLGLSLDMWQVRSIITRARDHASTGSERVRSATLLNMAAFVKINGQYAHVNDRFLTETERVFAALERDLRLCSGFQWHFLSGLVPTNAPDVSLSGSQRSCKACREILSADKTCVDAFEKFCATQMSGVFKDFVREKFQERVYSFYLKPSDAERFRRLNPADMSSARNIIAREQRELNRIINERFVGPQMSDVWAGLCEDYAEPAYTLLATLAAGYSVQQLCDGARLDRYVVSLSMLEPYLYNDERIPKLRSVYRDLHTKLQTTGTLRFRNKLVRSHGLMAPAAEIQYQHPVIAHGMNSVFLCHNGHMHRCPLGFGQAFVAWLGVMCTDENIGGQMSNRAFLHTLWTHLNQKRVGEAKQLLENANRRVKRWDPVKTLLAVDEEVERMGATRRNVTQF